MSGSNYKVGMIVTHPKKPEWGLGEIVTVTETSVHIYFKNDAAEKTRSFNRIYPNGPIGWDAPGFDTTGEKMEADVYYFAKPDKILSYKQLWKLKYWPTKSPGVYGWYFKKPPPYVPTKSCSPKHGKYKKWKLLYIGKASSDLSERILLEHFEGHLVRGQAMSSLRYTLGCLLYEELGIYLWKYPDFPKRGYIFGYKGEEELSKWMKKHARVAYVITENMEELENEAINYYTLPLNTLKNKRKSLKKFIDLLKQLKSDFRNCAPLLGSKLPKKAVKQAYKKFVRECSTQFTLDCRV